MKNLKYNLFFVFLLLLSVAKMAVASSPVRQEFSKNIRKEFNVAANGGVGLHNQYGKIEVKTWDKNQVSVDVTIIVRANSESEAQSTFDRIRIEFSEKPDYAQARTYIEPKSGSSWGWGWNNNSDYTINYEVFLPKTNYLDLTNKYGDSFVAYLERWVNADVKYGNIKMEGAKESITANVGYGHGSIGTTQNLTCNVGYGKLNVREATNTTLDTKYSEMTIEKATNVTVKSRYDTYEIGVIKNMTNSGKYDHFDITSAENLHFDTKYTDIKVSRLSNAANLNLEYGNLDLVLLGKNFNALDIKGSYTDCSIRVEDGANYLLDASTNYANIKYPMAMTVSNRHDNGTSEMIEGSIGGKPSKSVIKVRLNYGDLKVK